MPTTSRQLVLEAKRLERLQAKRRKQRRDLKATEGEIKLVKRNIKGLASAGMDPDDQLPPRWKGKVE